MKINTMISNSQRNFTAEAQALGSAATTRRGAIRYLLTHRAADRASALRGLRDLRRRVNVLRADGTYGPADHIPAAFYGPGSSDEWRKQRAARRAHPEAKRARSDAAFRRRFLARLRREERRLVADPGGNPDAAYRRLKDIAQERAVATGRPMQPVPPRSWMTRDEINARVYKTALQAGLSDDWDGTSYCDDRRDHFCLTVIDSARAPAYHAAPGTCIGLVRQKRRRVYARRSQFRRSDRADYFVVGRNENGNPYLHQVPATAAGSLAEAMDWIWQGAEIIARQGDVGVAASPLKHIAGEEADVDVFGGHSRHRFLGEVYRNGSLHVRSGFLYHTGGQHPTIYLDGSCWRRIVIGRRSERSMSTAD